ncbi:ankyrin repeat domain-containing protein 13C [Biomphalaria glabrata]|nr:ankyrin repeat domain-containing protein 13C [Biomphalaria glabrata]
MHIICSLRTDQPYFILQKETDHVISQDADTVLSQVSTDSLHNSHDISQHCEDSDCSTVDGSSDHSIENFDQTLSIAMKGKQKILGLLQKCTSFNLGFVGHNQQCVQQNDFSETCEAKYVSSLQRQASQILLCQMSEIREPPSGKDSCTCSDGLHKKKCLPQRNKDRLNKGCIEIKHSGKPTGALCHYGNPPTSSSDAHKKNEVLSCHELGCSPYTLLDHKHSTEDPTDSPVLLDHGTFRGHKIEKCKCRQAYPELGQQLEQLSTSVKPQASNTLQDSTIEQLVASSSELPAEQTNDMAVCIDIPISNFGFYGGEIVILI